jgi:hypothetical protein
MYFTNNSISCCEDGIYVCGSGDFTINGKITLYYPVQGIDQTPLVAFECSADIQDYFSVLIKYDFSGNPIWLSRIGQTYTDGLCVTCCPCSVFTGTNFSQPSTPIEQIQIFGAPKGENQILSGPVSLEPNILINKFLPDGKISPTVYLPPASTSPKSKLVLYETSTNNQINIEPKDTTIAGNVINLYSNQDGANLSLLYGGSTPKWFILSNNDFNVINSA